MGEGTRERDLVLAPNEFAFISDQTKGNINAYVGPYKTSLANTDQPVFFNDRSKRFERCSLEQSTRLFPTAPEGWYVVMKNPAKDGGPPKTGTVNGLLELQIGHKVNIPGPVSFALWPGQMVRVLKGHHLRSNQYLLVRVYDEEGAKANWNRAVIKTAGEGAAAAPQPGPDLTLGQHLVIKGTAVSFYIPPTGIEVVVDEGDNHVREAVTLERLEYCILLDENGNKRFIQGPAVVFPEPTETFVNRGGRRKFKAIELNENSGIYVKVIAPYEEGGKRYEVGDELFITGKEQMIYSPRPEHAVIKYGEQEIHYAVAIPAGEGRYCLDRQSGKIRLVRGPAMFLPDPRREVIVRRVLDPRHVALWFPGNEEALSVNLRLKDQLAAAGPGEHALEARKRAKVADAAAKAEEEAGEGFAGDDFNRKTKYTPPRTLTLDTKYEGAVAISVWTGYAVLVVARSGERQVIVGPHTHLLEYDQTLEPMDLSTGTPKTDEKLLKTVYLRVLHNKVSDVVEAETNDLVRVALTISYRVNFEGEPERWFDVENFVKFLTDHMRSLLRNAVKRRGIEEFYANSIDIVRDTVLGVVGPDGKRPGRLFEENGMRIYDVEVLDVTIGDDEVENLLVDAQQKAFSQTLAVASERRRLYLVEQTESVKRDVAFVEAQTRLKALELQSEEQQKRHEVELAAAGAAAERERARLAAIQRDQEAHDAISGHELGREQRRHELDLELERRRLEQRLAELKGEVSAVVDKAKAVSPDLVAALQAFGDRALVERVAESMAPLAILGGKSVAEVLASLLKGTPLEQVALDGEGTPRIRG
ncbi:MAG: SPFH domain-containing protein [Planctomycetota bacterium]